MFKLNSLDDNELVQRFVEGDQESLETLILRHKNRVFSYILLIVKNQELAEDIHTPGSQGFPQPDLAGAFFYHDDHDIADGYDPCDDSEDAYHPDEEVDATE